GGVPKLPVERADVTIEGLVGDGHNSKNHGGPDAAVCLFSLEGIEHIRAEGPPIAPGTVGGDITVAGLDWSAVLPGAGPGFGGGVELEVVKYTSPCSTIRNSFKELDFRRIKQDLYPGQSRVYARVLRAGSIARGEELVLRAAAPGAAAPATAAAPP